MSWHENIQNDPYYDERQPYTPEGCRDELITAIVGLSVLAFVFSIVLGII